MTKRLPDLALGYLTFDRATSMPFIGKKQRIQLVYAVRNRNTGMLYVLDELSIVLHSSKIVERVSVDAGFDRRR